jgi:hypothetical protein
MYDAPGDAIGARRVSNIILIEVLGPEGVVEW